MFCFKRKMIKNPSEIILSACVLMRYWACLYAGEEREMIKGETMLRMAIRILVEKSVAQAPKLLTMGQDKDSPERKDDQDGSCEKRSNLIWGRACWE
jgi:hypothetical protein